MLEQLLNSGSFDYAARGMQAAVVRHEVISHNIANVNTPYFRRGDVEFENLLAKELNLDKDTTMQVVRTHDRHLPTPLKLRAKATVIKEESTNARYDGNNVDIDREMAHMAKNQLYYNALANTLSGHVRKIKDIINSGGQSQ